MIRDQEDDKKKILNPAHNFPIVRRLGATNCSNISSTKSVRFVRSHRHGCLRRNESHKNRQWTKGGGKKKERREEKKEEREEHEEEEEEDTKNTESACRGMSRARLFSFSRPFRESGLAKLRDLPAWRARAKRFLQPGNRLSDNIGLICQPCTAV